VIFEHACTNILIRNDYEINVWCLNIYIPDILLLDEMFSTGDASFRDKSNARIKQLIDKSKIFVFASHDETMLNKYCNRIFRLKMVLSLKSLMR